MAESIVPMLKILHDITACIYRLNVEKPVSKWSFQSKLEASSRADLIQRLKVSSGVVERANELGIRNYKLKLQYKRNIAEPGYPSGRIFAIDTEEQYQIGLPLLQNRHELIVKLVEVQQTTVNQALSLNSQNIGEKRSRNDDDISDNVEKPKKTKPVVKEKKESQDKLLWKSLKEGLEFTRTTSQNEKLEKFKNDTQSKFPGTIVINERIIQCICSEKIMLNKLRCLANYTNHHLKSCSLSKAKLGNSRQLKEMQNQMKNYFTPNQTERTQVETIVDADDKESVDSFASVGGDCDEDAIMQNIEVDDNGIDLEESEELLSDLPFQIDQGFSASCAQDINELCHEEGECISDIQTTDTEDTCDTCSSHSDSSSLTDDSRDSDGFLKDPLGDDVRHNNSRYSYWDPVCERLQRVLDDDILKRDSIFYIYLKNALTFVTDIGTPTMCFKWDQEVIEFVESLEYHGHEKTINLLRGPGFVGTGKGGTKTFDWSSWNWPLPGKSTRKKNCTGYTTDSGLHKNLLQSFLKLASAENSDILPLVDNPTVKVVPIALKKDGMALKPGMSVDSRQGLVIGTTDKIDYNYIKDNPHPKPERLKEIFIKEAECYCATTLDGKISLPIGVEYINGCLNSTITCESIEEKAALTQTCLRHIVQSDSAKNGVLQAEWCPCDAQCNECLQLEAVCPACSENGHLFIEPSLRACSLCIKENKKCIKAITLVFSMDSESRNGGAQEIFGDKKTSNTIDPSIKLSECIADPVHVGKRISRQFSNWYLIVDGYRINRVQLRTLRNDPYIVEHLKGHLSVAACRNRDRMDVESMLEISSESVRKAIRDNVETITNTIIPEKFRLYEGNKEGVLTNPTALCLGPFGSIYVADASKGKLFSARLHYPVDVNEMCHSLSRPVDIAYTEGCVFIAEFGEANQAGRLSCVDLGYNMIYNPGKMNVDQLRRALIKLKKLRKGEKNVRKAELQQRLTAWMEANAPAGSLRAANGLSATTITVTNTSEFQRPTALAFNKANTLFVAEKKEILVMNMESNGIKVSASVISKISCASPTFGIAPLDDSVFIASSNAPSGGIIIYQYDHENKRLYDPKTIISNGSSECTTAHDVAILSSEPKKIVFTDVGAKQVKCLIIEENKTTVELLSGTGVQGQRDGSHATYCQPTKCCVEGNTIFVTDSATGCVKMITRPLGLLRYLEKLNTFLKVFGVHKRDIPRSMVKQYTGLEATQTLEEVYVFYKRCEKEVRDMIQVERTLQGPDGVCSPQTMRDLALILRTVQNITAVIQRVSPDYLRVLDFSSLTTLVVENFFSEMREGNDMPLVCQFSYRFSATVREHLKRSTKCSFNYFTSSSSYYTTHKGFLPFSSIPAMPKPKRNFLISSQQLAEMRKWRAEYGQSVRQLTVRNKSTKDNPGTLPINCYTTQPRDPQPVDFQMLANLGETATDVDSTPPLFMKGSFVAIKPGYQPTHLPQGPFFLGRCINDVKPSERRAEVQIFTLDFMLPLHFTDAHIIYTVDVKGILREITSISMEDDLVSLGEIEYSCCMIDCLDSGDTMTSQESAEVLDVDDTDVPANLPRTPPGRAGRAVRKSERQPKRPNFDSFLMYD